MFYFLKLFQVIELILFIGFSYFSLLFLFRNGVFKVIRFSLKATPFDLPSYTDPFHNIHDMEVLEYDGLNNLGLESEEFFDIHKTQPYLFNWYIREGINDDLRWRHLLDVKDDWDEFSKLISPLGNHPDPNSSPRPYYVMGLDADLSQFFQGDNRTAFALFDPILRATPVNSLVGAENSPMTRSFNRFYHDYLGRFPREKLFAVFNSSQFNTPAFEYEFFPAPQHVTQNFISDFDPLPSTRIFADDTTTGFWGFRHSLPYYTFRTFVLMFRLYFARLYMFLFDIKPLEKYPLYEYWEEDEDQMSRVDPYSRRLGRAKLSSRLWDRPYRILEAYADHAHDAVSDTSAEDLPDYLSYNHPLPSTVLSLSNLFPMKLSEFLYGKNTGIYYPYDRIYKEFANYWKEYVFTYDLLVGLNTIYPELSMEQSNNLFIYGDDDQIDAWNYITDKFSLMYQIVLDEDEDPGISYVYRPTVSQEHLLDEPQQIYFLHKVFTPVFFLEPDEELQNDNTFSRLDWEESDIPFYIDGITGIPVGGIPEMHLCYQDLCDMDPRSLPSFYHDLLTFDDMVDIEVARGPIAFHQALTRTNPLCNFLTLLFIPQWKEILYVFLLAFLCLFKKSPQAEIDKVRFQQLHKEYYLQGVKAQRLREEQLRRREQRYEGRLLTELELFRAYTGYLHYRYKTSSRKHARLIKDRRERAARKKNKEL